MLLIPWNTDAPIYYFPWATIALIVVNSIVTVAAVMNPEAAQAWILTYGDGLHPLQWITSNFIHGGGGGPVAALVHLLGNMIFLWGFGLVVEGKIGWFRFLAVYFGIGIAQCAFEQSVMLGAQPDPFSVTGNGSCGASAIIFGLMAMSLVWAPKNEISVLFLGVFLYRVFVHQFEVTILTFSLWHLALEGLGLVLSGFSGSSLLHLMGAAIGFPLGIVMLRMGWVDCENWDLFAVMNNRHGQAPGEDAVTWRSQVESWAVLGRPVPTSYDAEGNPAPALTDTDSEDIPGRDVNSPPESALRKFRRLLASGKPSAAFAEYQRLKSLFSSWKADEKDLNALVSGLYKAQAWTDVIPLLEEQIERCPAEALKARLRLAGLAVEVQQRPNYALRLLSGVPRENLTAQAGAACDRMERQARRLIADGVIEMEGRSWR